MKRYSEKEIEFVKSNLKNKSTSEMAERLRRSYHSTAHLRSFVISGKKTQNRKLDVFSCDFCSKEIKRRSDVPTKSDRHFCNNSCKNKFYSKDLENMECWENIVKKLIEAYGKKCWIPDCNYNKIIQGHHINPKSNNGRNHYSNCFLCCPNHHCEIHKGMHTTEKILKYAQIVFFKLSP